MQKSFFKKLQFGLLILVSVLFLGLLTGCREPGGNTSEMNKALDKIEFTFQGTDNQDHVTQDFIAPTEVDGYKIRWDSKHDALEVIPGGNIKVIRQEQDTIASLIAIIDYNNGEDSLYRSFPIFVAKKDDGEVTVEKFTIKFNADGVNDIVLEEGETLKLPEGPEKEGKEFLHWSLEEGGEAFDPTQPITGDVTLHPVYKDLIVETVTITFLVDGTQHGEVVEINKGEKVTAPEAPTKEHYIFVEWQLDGEGYDFESPVNEDITLEASFRTYTLAELADLEDDEIRALTVVVSKINDESGNHYWYEDETGVASGYKAPELAVGQEDIKVGDKLEVIAKKGTFSDLLQITEVKVVKALGEGTITEPTVVTALSELSDDMLNYRVTINNLEFVSYSNRNATFKLPDSTDKIVYRPNSGNNTNLIALLEGLEPGDKVNVVNAILGKYKDDYQLTGSTVNEIEIVPAETVTITLSTGEHTVEGYPKVIDDHIKGEVFVEPQAPQIEGYEFVEWQIDGVPYDFSQTVDANLTLVATYKLKQYTLTLPSEVTAPAVEDSTKIDHGTEVELVVAIPEGNELVSLKAGEEELKDNLVENKVTITITDNVEVTIEYQVKTFSLTLAEGVTATDAELDLTAIPHGTDVELLVTLTEGHHIKTLQTKVGETLTDLEVDLDNKVSINIKDNTEVLFEEEINTYELTLAEGVTATNAELDLTAIPHGTDVELLVTLTEGYHIETLQTKVGEELTDLEVDLDNKVSINITADTEVVFVEAINTYTLTLPSEVTAPAVEDITKIDHGTEVELVVAIPEGNELVSLKAGEEELKDNLVENKVTITITDNVEVTIEYQVKTFSLTLAEGVTATNAELDLTAIPHGTDVELLVTLTEGHHIKTLQTKVGETLTDLEVDLDNKVSINIKDNTEVLFEEEINTYELTLAEGVTATNAELDLTAIPHGTDVELLVTLTEGYHIETLQTKVGEELTDLEVDLDNKVSINITADTEVVFVEAINIYEVTFDAQGGTPVPEAQTVNHGGLATEPEALVKPGYSFDGWLLGEEAYGFATPVHGDVSLVASFTAIQPKVESVDGSGTNVATITFDQDVVIPNLDDSRAFIDNFLTTPPQVDLTQADATKLVLEYDEETFTLKITILNNFLSQEVLEHIDFNQGNGDGIYRAEFTFDIPTVVAKAEHALAAEAHEATYRIKLQVPVEDNKAQYTQPVEGTFWNEEDWQADRVNDPVIQYTVKTSVQGTLADHATVGHNDVVAAPSAPEVAGHTFSHWSLTDGGDAYNFETQVQEDFILYAVLEEVPLELTSIEGSETDTLVLTYNQDIEVRLNK